MAYLHFVYSIMIVHHYTSAAVEDRLLLAQNVLL